MQRRLQFAKKTVPEPFVPESGGSSPWWGLTLDITGFNPDLQKPSLSFFRRFTPHSWGQTRQDSSNA
jgi:hypothetical protein